MIEFLKEVLVILKNQLIFANETVEYTSWLTASIFSVLGVFTIFLSHQYQNHTAELKKLLWKMKSNVKGEDINEFEQNVLDFEYFSKTPKVLMKAVRTSKIVLWVLIPIWFLAGLSTFFAILNEKGTIHYLSLSLTISVTVLFIYFSIRLAIILSNLSDIEEDINVSTVTELFNASHLFKKNFNMTKLLTMNNTKWHFLLSGNEPYLKVKIDSELGIYNCSILLYMETIGYEVYLSTPIVLRRDGMLPKEIKLPLKSQQRIDIYRFFNHARIDQITISQIIMIEDKYYYFTGQTYGQDELIITCIKEKGSKIDLPSEVEREFKENVQIAEVNKLY